MNTVCSSSAHLISGFPHELLCRHFPDGRNSDYPSDIIVVKLSTCLITQLLRERRSNRSNGLEPEYTPSYHVHYYYYYIQFLKHFIKLLQTFCYNFPGLEHWSTCVPFGSQHYENHRGVPLVGGVDCGGGFADRASCVTSIYRHKNMYPLCKMCKLLAAQV